ncbi:MAG: hydrogenase expression/formation protein HypE [Bacteroidetes bacterium]|nr:hydrogenase expression/formation protein HypE [Bacteroidota bacterium]
MDKYIVLGHGSGGKLSQELIRNIFLRYFDNDTLNALDDSAVLPIEGNEIAFTTDSFVVDPIIFPGGDIGKLAICGTVNDLAVMGAVPNYLSAGFILEEGLSLKTLENVVKSMANTAKQAGIKIVTGDTKVVHKGQCDQLFINTSGIGLINTKFKDNGNVEPGDAIIINGYIADHGMTIVGAREGLHLSSQIQSDCACLHTLIQALASEVEIKLARDVTRGGLATVLVELVQNSIYGIEILESAIPLRNETAGICDMLGFDPLHVANEGKLVMVVPEAQSEKAITVLKKHELGVNAAYIGNITKANPGKVVMNTVIGGKRMIQLLSGEQLPRIC